MSLDWQRLVERIKSHQKFVLVSHIRPDCDALGSELGMAGILRSLGKDVRIVNGQATPPNLTFIDPDNRIQAINIDIQTEQLADTDIIMVLDTSAWAQLGPMGDVLRTTKALKIVLDHHVSSDDLGAEVYKNTDAEATGRLVLELAGHLGVKLTPEIATPLFAAIATDTGWFRFSSVNGDTYRRAAQLIDAGVRPAALYNALYEQDTLARVKLIGRILAGAEALEEGRVIHTHVTRADFDAVGALPSDTEDIINMTLAVGGTQVAVILVEQVGGGFKISRRSRCHVSCSKLAEKFGGGGHHAAAGAFLKDPLPVAQKKVLDAIREALAAK